MENSKEQVAARPRVRTDPKRLRREYRSESRASSFVQSAVETADERVFRMIQGPELTDAEKEILAAGPRRRAELFSRLLVTDLDNGERERYTIVPDGEGEPLAGKVSISSPFGRAFVNEYPGSIVSVAAPGGERLYRVLRVEES